MGCFFISGVAELLLLLAQEATPPPTQLLELEGNAREMRMNPSSSKRNANVQDEADRVPKVEDFRPDPATQNEGDLFDVRFGARAVWASVRGLASANNDFTQFQRGEDLDLHGDFGLDQGAALADFMLEVRLATSHRIATRTLFGTFWAHTTLDSTFEYNDNTFQSGEEARTTLEIDNLDVGYDYKLLDGHEVTVWMGLGARWAYVNVGLASTTLDPHGSMEESKAIFPTLHVDVNCDVASSVTLNMEAWGSPSAVATVLEKPSLGRFIEIRASIGWNLAGSLFLEGGVEFLWERLEGKIREPDQHFAVNRVDLLLMGPSIGLRVSF